MPNEKNKTGRSTRFTITPQDRNRKKKAERKRRTKVMTKLLRVLLVLLLINVVSIHGKDGLANRFITALARDLFFSTGKKDREFVGKQYDETRFEIDERNVVLPACSSLDGPFCVLVNGKKAPPYSNGASMSSMARRKKPYSEQASEVENLKSTMKDISNKLQDVLNENIDDTPYASGSFTISGAYSPAQIPSNEIKINLLPLRWRLKPGPEWVMVGIRGTISKKKEKIELNGVLVDGDGKIVAGCSEVVAVLVTETDLYDESWETILHDSVWKGSYECADLSTALTLTTSRASKTKDSSVLLRDGQLNGVFSFNVGKGPLPSTERLLKFLAESGYQTKKPNLHLTQAGCICTDSWSFNSQSFKKGKCGNPGGARDGDFCVIVRGSCKTSPEGIDWDYCIADWREKWDEHQKQKDDGVIYIQLDSDTIADLFGDVFEFAQDVEDEEGEEDSSGAR